ncbi:MAG: PD-(D/E)XK nuclease family protein [Nibricoccus sp.]
MTHSASSQPTPDLVFLGWARPLTELVAGWLLERVASLPGVLLVVPTRESGRRMRETALQLSSRSGRHALLGPRVAAPEDFFSGSGEMPDAVRWAAWAKVLSETPDEAVDRIFPAGLKNRDADWCLSVVGQIERARETLVSHGLRFGDLAEKMDLERERWSQLAALVQRVQEHWSNWGFYDPIEAKAERAADPRLPQGVREIVIAGVADPTPLALQSWQVLLHRGVKMTILVGAPESLRDAFDSWGRPIASFWSARANLALPPLDVRVTAGEEALSREVAKSCLNRTNGEVAIASCDPAFNPAIERAFDVAGWAAFDPQKINLPMDGWPSWLRALAATIDAPGDLSALVKFVQHPLNWLGHPDPAAMVRKIQEVASEWPGLSLHDDATSEDEVIRILQEFSSWSRQLGQDESSAFGELRRRLTEGQIEIAERIECELDAWPLLRSEGVSVSTRLRWLAEYIVGITQGASVGDVHIAIQGWLEVAFDPAPHLVIAGLHEGIVPGARSSDPLLSEAVRERFNVMDRSSRLACDHFQFASLVLARSSSGSVTIVISRVNPAGDPCTPSRLLLQASAEKLPSLVSRLFMDEAVIPAPGTPPWAREQWLLRPPAQLPERKWTHISPSRLAAYLSCPTRFFFTHVLGWDEAESTEGELSASLFGTLLHRVLKAWGSNQELVGIGEVARLQAVWRQLLADEVERNVGPNVPALVRLQIISAEERLMALAHEQVEQYADGWRVLEVEKEFNGVLSLSGIPLRLTIDRIDRHLDGRYRVVDYKTGKKDGSPLKAHLSLWSEEKDPEPCGPLCNVTRRNGSGAACAWRSLQLPLYAEVVRHHYKLEQLPVAYYAWMPEAVKETAFVEFEGLAEYQASALAWAENATDRIKRGVFWPPAPEVSYDAFARMAPEGLEVALGASWAEMLAGKPLAERRSDP